MKKLPVDREVDPAAVEALDLDDVTHCPLGDRCWSCDTIESLAITTADMSVGVMCATLCVDCYDGEVPDCSVVEATKRVVEHCAHLGTTIDVMYAKQHAEEEEIAQLQAAQQLDDEKS